jgi:hypothetical protein
MGCGVHNQRTIQTALTPVVKPLDCPGEGIFLFEVRHLFCVFRHTRGETSLIRP